MSELDALLHRIFPFNRSLTGNGVRMTLAALQTLADFQVLEIPSGTECYDWTVPDEWNIEEAYLEQGGLKVADFSENALHLVGYSEPIDAWIEPGELNGHIHFGRGFIPYRTSYYKRTWGFCVNTVARAPDATTPFNVVIRGSLAPGHMTYGERVLPGSSGREFLLSTYCCHPAMANDNCSGMLAWAMLLKELDGRKLRHSYRFLIAPETIGALAYISRHEHAIKGLEGGYVLNTCGGMEQPSYKRSFDGEASIDTAVRLAFRDSGFEMKEHPFDCAGSDERQYATPGLRVPFGSIHRSKYYDYSEYHTSNDDLSVVSVERIQSVVDLYLRAIESLEYDRRYVSLCPIGEPMLSKRGLYQTLGGANGTEERHSALRWQLQGAGEYTLDLAEVSGLPANALNDAGSDLVKAGLLREVDAVRA